MMSRLLLKPTARTINVAHARVNAAELRNLTPRAADALQEVRQFELELMAAANDLLRAYAQFYAIAEVDPHGQDDQALDTLLNDLDLDIE